MAVLAISRVMKTPAVSAGLRAAISKLPMADSSRWTSVYQLRANRAVSACGRLRPTLRRRNLRDALPWRVAVFHR